MNQTEPNARVNRTEHGQTVVMPGGRRFVPADVLTLLSGVNFGSVEKVLAAIHELRRFSGTDLSLLVDLSAVPTQRVLLGQERFARRANDTAKVVSEIAAQADDEITGILHLSGRF